jgi:hypothetical protein
VTANHSVELAFHHQNTVIAGLGRLEREALASEITAALHQGRPGLSADFSTQVGRRLEVQRPLTGTSRVVDVDTLEDVTGGFTVDGVVQPAAALAFRTSMRVTKADLVAAEATNDRVQRLAALDQDQLWGLAISLAELEVELARQTEEETTGQRISSEATEQIEQARASVDIAMSQLEEKSDQWIIAAASLTMISFVVAYVTHPVLAIPFLLGAIAVAYQSWNWHRQHQRALETEQALLGQFGLESYLDFQLRKVDALTNDTQQRRKSLSLAERRRYADQQWHGFVGPDVTLDWAAIHRPTITAAANLRSSTMFGSDEAMAETLSLALADRIREAAASEEPAPLIVDDIFDGQSDAVVERLLWFIDHHCRQLQFIVLTSDHRVLQWALERAQARQAAVIRLAGAEPEAEIDVDEIEAADASAGVILPR